MRDGKFVSCLRILADRLGLDLCASNGARNADRPNLQEALKFARAHRAALVKGAAIVVVGTLANGATDAQQVIGRTSDYEVTWSNSAFADTSALYGGSYTFGPNAFSNYDFSLYLLSSNAQNLTYYSRGGVTISPSTAPSPPYISPETIEISGNSGGSWGFSYKTTAGAGLPVTYGRLGALPTLSFDVGGFDDTGFTFGYYTYVHLPGDWTVQGTGPGDYIYDGVADGFSTPTFTYDPTSEATTVFTYDASFKGDGTGPALRFTLVGTGTPEAATWSMLLFGFASLGLMRWCASGKSAALPD